MPADHPHAQATAPDSFESESTPSGGSGVEALTTANFGVSRPIAGCLAATSNRDGRHEERLDVGQGCLSFSCRTAESERGELPSRSVVALAAYGAAQAADML